MSILAPCKDEWLHSKAKSKSNLYKLSIKELVIIMLLFLKLFTT